METSKITHGGFARALRASLIAAAVVALSGCWETFTIDKGVTTRTETEIAVLAIKDEWMKPCEGVIGGMPNNTTGNLLLDYTDLAAAGAECKERHNSFVDYFRPILDKMRASTPKAK